MSTITREFTKEQLIARAETVLSNARTAADFHNSKPYHLMDVHLAEIALASLEAEPVGEVSEQRDGLVMDGTVDLGGASTHRIIKGASKMKRLPFGTKFYTAPPAQANAEPVAWLWSHRKHPSEVSLVRPEDDERAEGAHWSGWSCQALYAAQPASAAMKDHQIRELVNELRDIAVEYHGTQQLRERIARTIRAAMLQGADGNSPVIPDGWVACVERMPSAGEQVLAYRPDAPESNDPLIKMATYVGGSAHGHGFDCYCKPTHWMPLPAAPQQEVKP